MRFLGQEPVDQLRSVLRYFDGAARDFDAIYSAPSAFDRIFRRDMYERFRKTLAECQPARGKSILDVGCGSGQYVIALAQQGARHVVGLDFAKNMLDVAEEHARRTGVSEQCQFVWGEFLAYPFDQPFDHVIAVGVFDYIGDPVPFLRKARTLTGESLIATFPRLLTWRAAVRKVRLRLLGCPVFFYTRRRVVDLMGQAGFTVGKLDVCGKIYWVTGTTSASRRPVRRDDGQRPDHRS
jgi:SAM-dependent methyltransferase